MVQTKRSATAAVAMEGARRSTRSAAARAGAKKVKVEDDEVGVGMKTPPKTPKPRVKKEKEKGEVDDAEMDAALSKAATVVSSSTKGKEKAGVFDAHTLKKLAALGTSPFPDYPYPTPEQCHHIEKALAKWHSYTPRRRAGTPSVQGESVAANCGAVPTVLDALVRTLLSQNTSNRNSSAAARGLYARFGRNQWDKIAEAEVSEVSDSIRMGGLANIKGKRIKAVLEEVKRRHGTHSLEHLRSPDITNEQAMHELVSLPGIGPKTASCVLLFCLARESFAVDTHVFRLTKKLGWVPSKSTREQAFEHLDKRVPEECKFGLHVLLIRHGRECGNCKAEGRGGGGKGGEGCPVLDYLREERSKGGAKEEDVDEEVKEEEEINEHGLTA